MPFQSDVWFLKAHCDPAVKQLMKSLELAKKSGASNELIESLKQSVELCRQRDLYTDEMTCKESKTCASIMAETISLDWQKLYDDKKTTWNFQPQPLMSVGHLEGQFLKSFLSAQKVKRVLEIGTYTGYSTVSIAETLPADGKIVSLDIDQYFKDLVESLAKDSPHKHKIQIVISPALKTMAKMVKEGQNFDAIFFDGDPDDYEQYLKFCLDDGLLAPGGTIFVDNAYLYGDNYTPPTCKQPKFGDLLNKRTDLHVVIVPLRDGIYLIRRRSDVDGGNV